MLDVNNFRNPDSVHSPGYFWLTSSPMITAKMQAQLREMAAHGAKSVCLHPIPREFRVNSRSTMTPRYLSEEYHNIVKDVVEEAARLGMNFYLYDEGGWPSGGACGQVVRSNPEKFACRTIVSDGQGGYKVETAEILPEGKANAPIPNVLEKEVIPTFLKLTHEAYAKHWGKHFGKTVRFAFTDEPVVPARSLSRYPWCTDFLPEFKKRMGYDIEPWLGKLVNPGPELYDALAEKRLDYLEVVAQLFEERYLKPIQEWCRRHGIMSGGHFGGEDEWFNAPHLGWGSFLRSLRGLDMPGVDMIWRQLYPGERLHPFPKLASSAAHQIGAQYVLGELFAIYGGGLQPWAMKFLLDYMLLCGVNTFVFSNIPLEKKKGGNEGGRPRFGEMDPLWPYYGQWHQYVTRMSWLTSQGTAVVPVAVYFDMRSLWLGTRETEYAIIRNLKVSDRIVEKQCDFDYVDDALLRDAKVVKGVMKAGKASYQSIVIPGTGRMPQDVQEKLAKFRQAGLPVYTMNEIEKLPVLLKVTPATANLRVQKRDLGNGEALYFVLNTSEQTMDVTLQAAETGPLYCADPERAEFHPVRRKKDGSWPWRFAPWSSQAFIIGKQKATPMPATPGSVVQEVTGWFLKPVRQFDYDACISIPQEKRIKAELGDWRSYLGDDFSGDACYSASFTCKNPGQCRFLDLGDVRFACSAKLNGVDLGARMLGPFVFETGDALKSGRNVLEITVTNTIANAVSTDHAREEWAKTAPLSFYEFLVRTFEKSSYASGLFGPVSIRE